MYMRDVDIAWLAGLLDGEGCFVCFKDKRGPHQINFHTSLAMVDRETVERAAVLMRQLSGDKVKVRLKHPRSGFSRRVQYVFDVSTKQGNLRVQKALAPYLVTKKLQCELMLSILERAVLKKRYKAIGLDFTILDLYHRLKRDDRGTKRIDCGEARAEAIELLKCSLEINASRQVTPSQAPSGSVKTDDEGEGVETSGLTPKNNDRHEPPEPTRH